MGPVLRTLPGRGELHGKCIMLLSTSCFSEGFIKEFSLCFNFVSIFEERGFDKFRKKNLAKCLRFICLRHTGVIDSVSPIKDMEYKEGRSY